jgi:hypothetical protein
MATTRSANGLMAMFPPVKLVLCIYDSKNVGTVKGGVLKKLKVRFGRTFGWVLGVLW